MREIRTFELDGRDAPTRWTSHRPQTLRVLRGQIWMTVEGEADDHWLKAGDAVELKPYSTIWVSGTCEGSRFALASASAGDKSVIEVLRAWFARRPGQNGTIASNL
ncbi:MULTISPECIES: DUF2917 domain-containing protein [unclassified Caballeronia]|uniref:DUF2917 domain-containing protein n=1 Tax=unclassified Caballeronia TaxID=2646786 RepID=UPI00286209C6|nr:MULTISPECIES: DUF2917 domain-containing protein [unclassified Caballeronia]MDR5739083.1 DUF2917 domain-containing protein [Caballeronia sp. LZ016]MDR5807571.1 DUF2917 domain-containing protein [Caballeronia sp. LZ019]